MGFFETDPPKKYLEILQQLRLIDDTFFDVCFDGNIEGMGLLLRIFFHRDDIIVKEVVNQRSANNLYGRGARFDVIAVDSSGKIYNVEIQRAKEGANPKRARFNSSLIDSREENKGTKPQDFPEFWIIFITEKDIFGANLPMYHIEHIVTELNRPFGDAAHIIYVNGEYLYSIQGDGMIFATPTGSTAYNLSAFGPIVDPKTELILMTPINAHTFFSRSIVLDPDDAIELEITPRRSTTRESGHVTYDGTYPVEMDIGDRLCIRKSDTKTRMVRMSEMNFLERMRRKLSETM